MGINRLALFPPADFPARLLSQSTRLEITVDRFFDGAEEHVRATWRLIGSDRLDRGDGNIEAAQSIMQAFIAGGQEGGGQ